MAAKLTRLSHKIAIQLHLVAESLPFAAVAPGGQSGNFWVHSRMSPAAVFYHTNKTEPPLKLSVARYLSLVHVCVCVCVALGFGLDERNSRVRFPAGAGNFSLRHRVRNVSGALPASYPMGTRGSFP
jgi:hypothetical protein